MESSFLTLCLMSWLCLSLPQYSCIPCCLVGSIPLGNIGWLPGTPPSPCRGKKTCHQPYYPCLTDSVTQFHQPQFCLLPAGVRMGLTWLGNLSGGRGPPGYRGDINGWKNTWTQVEIVRIIKCLRVFKNSCHHSKTTKTLHTDYITIIHLVKHNISIIHVYCIQTMSLSRYNWGKLNKTWWEVFPQRSSFLIFLLKPFHDSSRKSWEACHTFSLDKI